MSSDISSTPVMAVEVAGVAFSHGGGGEPALEDVSFEMRAGEFLALIGPNGGGKSTLLRLLAGLLRPGRGEVKVFGSAPAAVCRQIGYVPQFSALSNAFPATVLEMTLMGAAVPGARGGSWGEDRRAKEKALAYLDIFGLAQCAKLPLSALSGGQRRRALVARALTGGPEGFILHPGTGDPEFPFLLLLDEPTAGIDAEGAFCFYEFLGGLRGGISVVVASHDLYMVSPFFDHAVFVNRRLTRLSGVSLTPENLAALFGPHLHSCPLADVQHSGGIVHSSGCTHPACASGPELRPDKSPPR